VYRLLTNRKSARQCKVLLPYHKSDPEETNWTALPMPDKVIDKVNRIGKSERQGREFRFLNRSKESYRWTNSVPEDDPEFQGLLEEEAPFPELSAQLPGVPLECDEEDEVFEVVTDKPEPDFDNLAAAALDNAGIDTGD
jgi:hypothetical protein